MLRAACLSAALLACALAVKLSSPGPVLFTQRRVGKNGREFTMATQARAPLFDTAPFELRGRSGEVEIVSAPRFSSSWSH